MTKLQHPYRSRLVIPDSYYILSEADQYRLVEVAKAAEYLADMTENIPLGSVEVTLEHFGSLIRVLSFVTSDIANKVPYSGHVNK